MQTGPRRANYSMGEASDPDMRMAVRLATKIIIKRIREVVISLSWRLVRWQPWNPSKINLGCGNTRPQGV
jgi:hypothetical protein